MSPSCTTYQLWIRLAEAAEVEVGRLGRCAFPAGWYVYTGSARRHRNARLRRHCRPAAEKRLRWHIDFFLAAPGAEIRYIALSGEPECRLNAAVGGRVVCPGLGASDCRAGCGSHLRHLGEDPGLPDLALPMG
ncbi:MAG: GIY-YIG nuclease family protein [Thiohalorhabdus sp.]